MTGGSIPRSPLQAARLALGLKQLQAAEQLDHLARRNGKPRVITAQTLCDWEAGRRITLDAIVLLCEFYQRTAEQLGLLPDFTATSNRSTTTLSGGSRYARAEVAPLGERPNLAAPGADEAGRRTNRQQFLSWTGATALVAMLESMRLTRGLEGPDPGPMTHEQLDLAVDQLVRLYEQSPPALLADAAHEFRQTVTELLVLQQRHQQRQHLYLVGGQLSLLLGVLAFDEGTYAAARSHCITAWQLGQLAGHGDLCARVRAAQSMITLYQGRFQEALALARDGQRYAPAGSSAVALLATRGEAWALARLGDRAGVDDAVERAAGAMASLPAGAQPAGLFSFRPAAQEGCAGAAYLWAGVPDRAQAHIQRAIALNGSTTEPRRGINPLMAQLDLAATFVHLDEPERACSIASEVLGVPRSRLIDPMVRRAEELAAALDTDRYRTLPAVVSLTQEIQEIAPRPAAGLPRPR